MERHERHQPGSRLHEVSDLSRLVADGSVERSEDAGEGKIALRHLQGGHELVSLARGLVLLRLEHIEIGLCAVEGRDSRRLARLGGGQGGDGAVTVSSRLLETLLRAEVCLRELERPVIFQRRPLDLGLGALLLRRRRIDLGSGLGDDCGLGVYLPAEAGDGRVLSANPRPGRVDRVLIVAVVDRSEQVALVHDLVVNHGNRGEMAHRLGGDDRGVGADIGVVGRDEETSLDEIVVGRFAAIAERGQNQNRDDEPAKPGALSRSSLDDGVAAGGYDRPAHRRRSGERARRAGRSGKAG